MKIALCQMKMSEDMMKNQRKSLDAMRAAATEGAELILFPEIQCCPFFPQYEKQDVEKYAMPIEHTFVKEMQRACKENHIMAAPNIYLEAAGHRYDATLLIDSDGTMLGLQKMVHIAQAEKFYEQDYYTPSEEGFCVFDTKHGKIGVVVCFDRHYPESIRTEALMGAELILIPTANTLAEPSDVFEWELRIQAFHSSVAIAMCNRVGEENEMHFSGESIVVGPDGSVIAKANATEQILYAEIDVQNVRTCRDSKPYTQLRRPELYR